MSHTEGELANLTRGWNAPAELTGSPPRPVGYSALGMVLMVLAAAMLVGGGVLGYTMYSEFTRSAETGRVLAAQGSETGGTVTRLWRRGGKNESFLIAYEFQAGGRVFHGESSASRAVWSELTEGKRLTVRYLPADPSVNRLADVAEPKAPFWTILLIPATFSVLTVFVAYKLPRQRRLLEDGRAAPGVITRMRRTKNGRAIRYDFLLPGGGKASGSGIAKRGPWDVGSVITVVYDPDDPGRNEPYPLGLVKIAQ